jgi:hypothetical protein
MDLFHNEIIIFCLRKATKRLVFFRFDITILAEENTAQRRREQARLLISLQVGTDAAFSDKNWRQVAILRNDIAAGITVVSLQY